MPLPSCPEPEASLTPEADASPKIPTPRQIPDASPTPCVEPGDPPVEEPPEASPVRPGSLRSLPTRTTTRPGSLVILIGEGWQADELVCLDVNDDEGKSWALEDVVTRTPTGAFAYEFRLPDRFVAVYTVVADGETSGRAVWRFTDAIGTGDATDGDNGWFASSEVTVATPSPRPDACSSPTSACPTLVPASSAHQRLVQPGPTSRRGGWTSYYRVVTGGVPTSYTWRFRNGPELRHQPGQVSTGATGGIVSYAGVDTAAPIRACAGAPAAAACWWRPHPSVQANDIIVRHFGTATGGSPRPHRPTRPACRTPRSTRPTAASSWRRPSRRPTRTAERGAPEPCRRPSRRRAGLATPSSSRRRHPSLTLTIPDDTADFGTNLTPNGRPSNSADAIGVSVAIAAPATTGPGRSRSRATRLPRRGGRIDTEATPALP